MGELEEIAREVAETAEDAVYAIRGGPNRLGKKLLKTSGFFLVVPDPTMISTTIGVSMVVAGKLLNKRREKGLLDELESFSISLAEAAAALEELKGWRMRLL